MPLPPNHSHFTVMADPESYFSDDVLFPPCRPWAVSFCIIHTFAVWYSNGLQLTILVMMSFSPLVGRGPSSFCSRHFTWSSVAVW